MRTFNQSRERPVLYQELRQRLSRFINRAGLPERVALTCVCYRTDGDVVRQLQEGFNIGSAMKMLFCKCLAMAVLVWTSPAQADLIWTDADTVDAGGWSVIADSQAISLSSTGTGDLGATGTSFASASLADGYLKASVSTNSISAQGNLIEIG